MPSILKLVAFIAPLVRAIYLPGVAPIEYAEKDQVDLKVNKLTSVKTQLPYRYYTLPYCQPKVIVESAENLGEILTGDQIENSAYEIAMKVDVSCKVLCKLALTKEHKAKFMSMIDDEYLVNWMVDNLPPATRQPSTTGSQDTKYTVGFPVGAKRQKEQKYYIYNHMKLDFKYHTSPSEYEGFRIVGFEVEPSSLTHKAGEGEPDCTSSVSPFALEDSDELMFTYDVQWSESDIRWASRWDNYLKVTGATKVHWFSILNSVMITVFLTGMVALILLKTLHRDIAMYNEAATADDVAEESGWKLVHGDVFRKPRFSKLLAVSVGTGMQILGMAVVTLICAACGFLSPQHRGGILQSCLLLYTIMGVVAGYTMARFYQVFNGDDWKLATLMTAFFYPGIFFAIFFFLNLLIWGQKSSGAVPFLTMFVLLVLWFGVTVPLVFLGAYFGFRRAPIELPVRTNQIPRQIPKQPGFLHPVFTALLGGVLPFGAAFCELFFIMSSLWQHQFYYLFGFLALVQLILLITCSEISIALTYFQLTFEDYNWWWRSFFASGASSVYVFLYSIMYFSARLHIEKLVSSMLYFGYMTIISVLFFLLTGSIGTVATFFFIRTIYSSIKID